MNRSCRPGYSHVTRGHRNVSILPNIETRPHPWHSPFASSSPSCSGRYHSSSLSDSPLPKVQHSWASSVRRLEDFPLQRLIKHPRNITSPVWPVPSSDIPENCQLHGCIDPCPPYCHSWRSTVPADIVCKSCVWTSLMGEGSLSIIYQDCFPQTVTDAPSGISPHDAGFIVLAFSRLIYSRSERPG